MKLIVYEGVDEVLVCHPKTEKLMIKTYFGKSCGRDIENYDRSEKRDMFAVHPKIRVS